MEKNYFKNLESACQKLEKVDKFINNEDNIFEYILPIINIFNIIKNTNNDELLFNSIALIINIKNENPKLKGIVDAIIEIINNPISPKMVMR